MASISFLISIMIVSPIVIDGLHIGLFASTGCYSHDVMMRHFADRLASVEGGGHQVTVIQIRVFEFSLASSSSNSSKTPRWNHLVHDALSHESTVLLGRFQHQMWTSLIPYDVNHPKDLLSAHLLTLLHDHHVDACYKALTDPIFMGKVKKLRLDLLVTDYVLNECALRFGHVMDVNVAYLSNYPVLSSYAVDVGISSIPSYVPSLIGYETTRMHFPQRLINSLYYFFLWSSRQYFDYDANQLFKRALGNRFFKKARKGQRSVIAFATPFEAMLDTARPLARNLHYFGCDHCYDGEQFDQDGIVDKFLNTTLSGDGVILVSFGTITNGDRVPVVQLQRLIRTFAKFPTYTFIWQLDKSPSAFTDRILKPINATMPSNVRLFKWIPLKRLMSDKKIILSINHGGISTCSEAEHHGIPILGVALQGDQGYNLRRLSDKGIGEMLPVSSLTDELMTEKLSIMVKNIDRYRSAARKLRSMIRDHKSLYKGISPSAFWIAWTARHFGHGRNGSEAAIKTRRFLTLRYTSNWFLCYNLDTLSALAAAIIVIVRLILILRDIPMSALWNNSTKKVFRAK